MTLLKTSAHTTLHCLTGCVIGEVLGLIIAVFFRLITLADHDPGNHPRLHFWLHLSHFPIDGKEKPHPQTSFLGDLDW